MNRNSVQTVTLPILVRVDRAKDADGRATFLSHDELEEVGGYVREVTTSDAKHWQKEMTPKERALFSGVGKLYWALNERDEYSLRQAYESLRPHVPLADPDSYKMAIDLKRGTVKKSVVPGVNWFAVGLMYSGLVTEEISGTRTVMWVSEKHERFMPALYCRDKVSAIFAMQFLVQLIRICPKCETPFIPQASNVDYCSPAHRESHRVARGRWWTKRRKEQSAGSSPKR